MDEVSETIARSAGFVVGSPTLGGHMPTQVCRPAAPGAAHACRAPLPGGPPACGCGPVPSRFITCTRTDASRPDPAVLSLHA